MPRGGFIKKSNFNREGRVNYDEHDDRDRKRTQRRVSFKPSNFNHANKRHINEIAIKAHLGEEDDTMDEVEIGGVGRNKFRSGDNRHNRRRGSPIPKGKLNQLPGISKFSRSIMPSSFGWYQVTIPYGQKYRKEDLIRILLETISPEVFIPHYWREEKTMAIFYVDDAKIATLFQNKSGKVQMSDGFRLNIRVRSGVPPVIVDEPFKDRMKLVMAKRYNSETKALDLSQFHADPGFKDMFCALFRPQVMSAVLNIIETNIPNLEALNLNGNRITAFEGFRNIAEKVPNLKILYLEDNRITSLGALMVFRDLPVIELVLSKNPLKNRYKDETVFIGDIRRKFPKLLKLDGKMLEPHIGFDVEENKNLPKPEASYFCNAAGVDIVREFLKQYFLIYDSENRQPLLDAYHEQAMLSLSVPLASQSGRLSAYRNYNHNLLRTNDKDGKFRLIKTGKLQVVSFLTELPKTQHDLMSFSVDLSIFTPTLIVFTVAGLFKEILATSSSTSQAGDLRYFQRLFVVIPGMSGGYCIRNEMMLITVATHLQHQKAFKEPEIVNVSETTSTNSRTDNSLQSRLEQGMHQPVPTQISSIAPVVNDAAKIDMVREMSERSGMNLEWSKKCLEDTNWDFNYAAFVFDKLQKESKIPPQAFVK
ncbi:nuclear RNA export factor 1 [Condylostylus longicornis]|uniref:nuclear RNA export factor 1 n=1 Tax=Condylostylus longicornis TaxID=2530218 RepID=UPI00244DD7A2|nr:nuclear RNA export factor 1 [Condylostylus longicornis]